MHLRHTVGPNRIAAPKCPGSGTAAVMAGGRWTSKAPERYNTEPEASAPSSTVPQAGANGSGAGSNGDEPGVARTAHGEPDRAAVVCTTVGCTRPARMSAQFSDDDGTMHARTICCFTCVTGEGHSDECDASSAS